MHQDISSESSSHSHIPGPRVYDHHTHRHTHHGKKSSPWIQSLLIGGPVVFIALLIAVTASLNTTPKQETSLMMQQEPAQYDNTQMMEEESEQVSWISRLFGGKKQTIPQAPVITPVPTQSAIPQIAYEESPQRLQAKQVVAGGRDNAAYCLNGYLKIADATSSYLINPNAAGQPQAVQVNPREGNVSIPYPVFESDRQVDEQLINASQPSIPTKLPIARFGAFGYPYLTHVMVYDADTQLDTDTNPTNTNPNYPSSYLEVTYASPERTERKTPAIIYPLSGANVSMVVADPSISDVKNAKRYYFNIADDYVKEIKFIPGRHWPIDSKGDRRDSSWFGGICGAAPVTPTPTTPSNPTITPTRAPIMECTGLMARLTKGIAGDMTLYGANATHGEIRVSVDNGTYQSLGVKNLTVSAGTGNAVYPYTVPSTATSIRAEGRVCNNSSATTCSPWGIVGAGLPIPCTYTQTYTNTSTTPTRTVTPTKTLTRTPTKTPTPTNKPQASCLGLSAVGSSVDITRENSYRCKTDNATDAVLYVYENGSTTPNQTLNQYVSTTTKEAIFNVSRSSSSVTNMKMSCSACNDVNNNDIYEAGECTQAGVSSVAGASCQYFISAAPVAGAPICKQMRKETINSSDPNMIGFTLIADQQPPNLTDGLRAYVQITEDGVVHSYYNGNNGSTMTYNQFDTVTGPFWTPFNYSKKAGVKNLQMQLKVCEDKAGGKCAEFGSNSACAYTETTTVVTPTVPPSLGCPDKIYFYQDSGSANSQLYSANVSGNLDNLKSPTKVGGLYPNCDIEAAEAGFDNRLFAFMGSGRGTVNNGWRRRNPYDGWVMQIDPDTGALSEYFSTGYSELTAAARENVSGDTVIVKSEYCDVDHQGQGCFIRVNLRNKTAQYLFRMDTNIEALTLDKSGSFFWGVGNSSTSRTASGGRTLYKIFLTPQSNGLYYEKASWSMPGSKDVEAAFTLGQISSQSPDDVLFGLHNQADKSFVVMDMKQTAANIAVTPVLKQSIGTTGTGVYDPESIFQVCGTPSKPVSTKVITNTDCEGAGIQTRTLSTTSTNVPITVTYNASTGQVALTWRTLTNITKAYFKRYAIKTTDSLSTDVRVYMETLASTATKATNTPSARTEADLYSYVICLRVSGETQDRCSTETQLVPLSQISTVQPVITLPNTAIPAAQVMVQEPVEIEEPTFWQKILSLFGI